MIQGHMLLSFLVYSDVDLVSDCYNSVRKNPVGQLRTVLGLCHINSLAVDAQQEEPYKHLPRIYHFNYYAVLRLLICSLSGHRPEEAWVRELETLLVH